MRTMSLEEVTPIKRTGLSRCAPPPPPCIRAPLS